MVVYFAITICFVFRLDKIYGSSFYATLRLNKHAVAKRLTKFGGFNRNAQLHAAITTGYLSLHNL